MSDMNKQMREIRDGYVRLETIALQVLAVDPDSQSAKETIEMTRRILSKEK